MNIYLVSLSIDVERRENLKERFKKYYKSFIHIEAIDGRILPAGVFYKKIIPYFLKNNKIMSPAELGCTLSHIKALNEFLQTDEPNALIIEDDIIGNDQDLESIFESSKKLDKKSLLLCGGQEGLSKRYQIGEWDQNNGMYKVCHFSYKFVLRTCCYVVTRESAQKILDYHIKSLTLADKWDDFFQGTDFEIYYKKIIEHPEDLSGSHIEAERAKVKNKTFTQKVFSKDAPSKILMKFINEIIRLVLIILKYKQLK